KPLPALVKKTFSIITREYAILLNFVIGIMMPMIIFVMGLSSGDITDAGWASGIVYIGFQVHMVHNAISGGEEKVGSVLTSMPVKTWDVYNARRITMYLNQGISTAICMVLVLCLARDPLEIVMYQTVLISLAMVTVPLYLILYSIAFCRLNGRYTLFINTNVNRGGKLAVMIISCYAIAIVEILFMEMNSRPVASLITEMVLDFSGLLEIKHSVTPFGAAIVLAAIWIVNVSMAAGLEVAARRLFKNRREPQA
nr:hypothetical protein [Candidatus Sigynarchaeota archaeon]